MKPATLPLFEKGELKRLQERREALLKRLHHLPPHSRKKTGLEVVLSEVTTEMIRIENRLSGGDHVR